jgi:hypothetical protein
LIELEFYDLSGRLEITRNHAGTWGDLPVEQRAAGPWGLPGSYDPKRKVLYRKLRA